MTVLLLIFHLNLVMLSSDAFLPFKDSITFSTFSFSMFATLVTLKYGSFPLSSPNSSVMHSSHLIDTYSGCKTVSTCIKCSASCFFHISECNIFSFIVHFPDFKLSFKALYFFTLIFVPFLFSCSTIYISLFVECAVIHFIVMFEFLSVFLHFQYFTCDPRLFSFFFLSEH